MKKLIVLLCICSIMSCKEEVKDYVTINGKISNPAEEKTLTIFKGKDYKKEIAINDDGTFNDTLKVDAGDYSIKHGQEYGNIYLKNGNVSTLETNYEDFDKTLKFSGDDSDINNFTIQSYLVGDNYFTEDLVTSGSQEDLDNAIKGYKDAYDALKTKYKGVDSTHLAQGDKGVEGTISGIKKYMASKIAMRKEFPKGKPSPSFENYENYKGGATSLADLKGKFVYVDVWATWCGPCKREIPSLKKVEKQFHGKNIEFVSISVDNGRGYKADSKEASAKKAKEGWKKMIKDKELGGIQLYADNAFNSKFIRDYKINGIPRFILIDPAGNIVSADAPRPSNPKLIELFESLNI